jgi:acetylornithine/succinyldiaminopimelate/putrescine aminotransferase
MGHAFRSLYEAFFATVSCFSIYFHFRAAMTALQSKGCSFIAEVRGRGLLNAVEVDPSKVLASSPSVAKSIFNIYFHLMLFASGVSLGFMHQNGLKRAARQAHPRALHRRRSTSHPCCLDH